MKTNFLLFLFFIVSIKLMAQNDDALSEAYITFDNIINQENTKLYNGKRYYNLYKSTIESHNFFNSPSFIKGNVTYDKAPFFNIDLRYDLVTNQLIFKPTGQKSFVNIELIEDKVSKFQLNGHQFINSKTLQNNKGVVSGYLEVIYTSSALKLYAKRKKTVSERIKNDRLTYIFSNEPSYFLSYNGQLHEIDSKKTFRKIFKDYAKELKIEIKENKFRFKKDNESLYLYLTQWISSKLNAN